MEVKHHASTKVGGPKVRAVQWTGQESGLAELRSHGIQIKKQERHTLILPDDDLVRPTDWLVELSEDKWSVLTDQVFKRNLKYEEA